MPKLFRNPRSTTCPVQHPVSPLEHHRIRGDSSASRIARQLGTCQVRADSAETFLSTGAGVRAFYAHQFQFGLNWQNVGYTLKMPRDGVNDIRTP